MKKYIKSLHIPLLLVFMLGACDFTDLDLQTSPNDLAADAADPNLLLNSIQIAYAANQEALNEIGAELVRLEYFFGRDYFNNLPGSTMNDVWQRTYSSGTTFDIGDSGTLGAAVGILTNLQSLEAINAESDVDYSFHIGVGKTLYAHSLLQLVDFLGEAAFTQAGNAAQFPAPTLDDGASVYSSAISLLDEAVALFSASPSNLGAQDLYYGGDASKWLKAANSIKLRSYVLTGNQRDFDAIIASGDYISSSDDDLQVQFGTSALQPDNRHTDYAADYTPSGANIYQSNWLMDLMNNLDDPRRQYYFYRQVSGTPGSSDVNGVAVDPNEEELACSLVVPPSHYDGFVYCSVNGGYWGRSHGNNEGTPPDNFRRTAAGVYPAGGRFDDNSFGNVGLGLGGGGAGIEPIILSSYVDFWQAIMADNAGDKATFLRSGLEKSMAKVQSFGALDASADLTTAPTSEDVTAYIDGIVDEFNNTAGDDQENVFGEQYFITLFGSGVEAYNYYRFTGYPTTVIPNWEPDPGPFPRTLLLPQNEVINNPNLNQRSDLTTQVFWDNNPPSPAFPPAN